MWALDKVVDDENLFNSVLFINESTFENNGTVYRHNFHYYSESSPYQFGTINNPDRR